MGRDVHVVAERQGQLEGALAGEAGQHVGEERQLERLHRAAPARPVAEQVDDHGGLGVGVGPPDRLDPDLATQREGVHAQAGGIACPHAQQHRRGGGVVIGDDLVAREVEVDGGAGQGRVGHAAPVRGTLRARSSRASNQPSMRRHTSAPPPSPVQLVRTTPTSS